ncbi:MAG TPA: amidohydrolase family protein [Blastocatellia bacterium]
MKKATIASLMIGLICSQSIAQSRAQLAPPLRQFVSVDSPVVVLKHVRVIDGTGAAPQSDRTIILENGKIKSVGDSSTPAPEGAKVLDLQGYTVIPGLVGMHEHMFYPAPRGNPAMYPEHSTSFPRLYLAGGVTTMRTTGSVEPYSDLWIKHAIEAGSMVGPKIHVTGPYLEGSPSYTPQMHELTGAEDARRTVEYWEAEGATSFKAYMHITPDELAAAVKAAHARGIKVTGHLCSIGFKQAAAIGIDDLEHGLVVDTEFFSGKQPDRCPNTQAAETEMARKLDISGPAVQGMIKDLVAHSVAVTSTLPVFETFVPNRGPDSARVLDAMTPEARISYLTTRATISDHAAESIWPALFKKEMQFEHDFVKAGGLLLAGLDPTGYGGVIAGFGDQREVILLVEAGFTPVEAIQIATANGAKFLGELDKIGTIEPGKDADLVVIHGNPAENIADIEKVETVFKDGVGYDSQKLIDSVKGLVGER